MRRYVARLTLMTLATSAMISACGDDSTQPRAAPCRGLVDVSDSAAFVKYGVDGAKYWDVTLAMLQNPCPHSIDIVSVDVGTEADVTAQGVSVAPKPDQVFAAAPVEPVALPALEPFVVPAGGTVQVVGRFAVSGVHPARVPPAALAFRVGQDPGTLTLTPTVSLCTCGPPA